jgi:hypothetical protein
MSDLENHLVFIVSLVYYLARYEKQIVPILIESTYNMTMDVLQGAIQIADIVGICRRCILPPFIRQQHYLTTTTIQHRRNNDDKHPSLNFKSNAAMNILLLVTRFHRLYNNIQN